MNYQLHHGDCLEIMPTLPAQSVDAIICDPPYGTTACKWDSVIPFVPMWECIKYLIKPRGAVVLFGSQPFTSALVMSNPKWFRHEWVWDKRKGANFGTVKFEPLKVHENVIVFSDGAIRINHQFESEVQSPVGKIADSKGNADYFATFGSKCRVGVGYPRSIQKFPIPNNWTGGGLHPTQKPVDLLAYLIKTYTNEGDTVLDFTCGSGSTGVACAETGRNFIGIELDEAYFKIASDRIESAYRKAQGLPRQGKPTDFADMPLFP